MGMFSAIVVLQRGFVKSIVKLGIIEKLLTRITMGQSVLPQVEASIRCQSIIQIGSLKRLKLKSIMSYFHATVFHLQELLKQKVRALPVWLSG